MTVSREPSLNFNAGTPFTENFSLTAVQDATFWVLLAGDLAVQITGDATSVTMVMERSTMDPNDVGGNPVVVDPDGISGNPSAGLSPYWFAEPGAAWWRARVTALSGTDLHVSISGKKARL